MVSQESLIPIIEASVFRLTKNYESDKIDYEYHNNIRLNYLKSNFDHLVTTLTTIKLKNVELLPELISAFIVLYKELISDGPWTNSRTKEFGSKLDNTFKLVYGMSLDDFYCSRNVKIAQGLFSFLNRNIAQDTFQQLPSLIDIYERFTQDIKIFELGESPVEVLQVSLILIDDCMRENKVQGFRCCLNILEEARVNFLLLNYHDVLVDTFKKFENDKDLEITELFLLNLTALMNRISYSIFKIGKLLLIFDLILKQLQIEANIARKVKLFIYCNQYIKMCNVNCIRKQKMFYNVIYDALDECCNFFANQELRPHVLTCLTTWFRFAWCTWTLSNDYKVLHKLIKLYYIAQHPLDTSTTELVERLIVSALKLCTEDEIKNIKECSKVTDFDLENIKYKLIEHWTCGLTVGNSP